MLHLAVWYRLAIHKALKIQYHTVAALRSSYGVLVDSMGACQMCQLLLHGFFADRTHMAGDRQTLILAQGHVRGSSCIFHFL